MTLRWASVVGLREGDASAREQLWPLVHDELRRLAGAHMRDQKAGHTLQPTALVHEVYLKLVDADLSAQGRGEFFALASKAIGLETSVVG